MRGKVNKRMRNVRFASSIEILDRDGRDKKDRGKRREPFEGERKIRERFKRGGEKFERAKMGRSE